MRKLKKLRLSRQLGQVNIYRKDKFHYVFRNIGLTAQQVKTTLAFAATRTRASVFARASPTAARLYRLLAPMLGRHTTKNLYRNILSALVKEINRQNNPKGRRGLLVLKSFPCNTGSFPQPLLHEHCTLSWHRRHKTVHLALSSLCPVTDINPPIGATHIQLTLLLAAVEIKTGNTQCKTYDEPIFYRIAPVMTRPTELSLQTPLPSSQVLIAAIGLRFWYASGEDLRPFNNRQSDIADILACRLPYPLSSIN